jgi:hypothetical protein
VCLDDQHRNQPDDGRVGFIGRDRFGAVTDFETKIDILADFVRRTSAASSAVP